MRNANGNGTYNLVIAEKHSTSSAEGASEQFNTFWLTDSTGNKISKLYEGNLASDFAVSHDGKRIAIPIAKNIEGQVYFGLIRLLVLDIEKNETSTVYEKAGTSPHDLKWSPNDELVTYIQGAGARIPIADLRVTSTDGSYRHTPYTGLEAPTSYIVSGDGSTVLVGINPYLTTGIASKLYKLELAHPIPEFGPFELSRMAAGIVGIIIITRGFGNTRIKDGTNSTFRHRTTKNLYNKAPI